MSHPSDTIVAIATPVGQAALGTVRLSGPDAVRTALACFRSKSFNSHSASHTLHHGWIWDNDRRVDEVVLAFFRGPNSFTGEDVIEIFCHGNPLILSEVIAVLQAHGARLALPGEFSQRAFLNGKIDLVQAEAVAELISAKSQRAHTAAMDQLVGGLSQRVRSIREHLLRVLARLEANLDFAEEAIPELPRAEMRQQLDDLQELLDQLIETSARGRQLRDGIRVALVGRPNVGKSSLFNALLAEERAIVTAIPGTTRDVLEEIVQWDGWPVVLSDTAGLRETDDEVERHGTERTRRAQRQADVIIFVVDGSGPPTAEDALIEQTLQDKKYLIAQNKSDLGEKYLSTAPVPFVKTSATTLLGLADLKKEVLRLAALADDRGSGITITNARHAERLQAALAKVKAAQAALQRNASEEAIAVDIREALENLSAITGEQVGEDVLSEIFRQFCIGK